MGAISLLLYVSAGITATAPYGSVHRRRHERIIQIEAKRFEFNPNTIVVKRGERVRLRLIGADDAKHGLRIPDLGVDTEIAAGQSADVVIEPAKTGTFAGTCSVYCGAGHKSMAITVEVHR